MSQQHPETEALLNKIKSLKYTVSSLEVIAEKYEDLLERQQSDAERFRQIFESSLDIMVVVNTLDSQILFISNAIETYLGYSPESLIRKRFSVLFSEMESNKRDLIEHLRAFDAVLMDQPFRHADGHRVLMDVTATIIPWNSHKAILFTIRSTEERREAEEAQQELLSVLENAVEQVRQLSGFLPICTHCKSIRDDAGFWTQVEEYIRDHTDIDFSHSICPTCVQKHYSYLDRSG